MKDNKLRLAEVLDKVGLTEGGIEKRIRERKEEKLTKEYFYRYGPIPS